MSYRYNGVGQRVSKVGAQLDGGANVYVYDEEGHLLGEYDANGAPLQETVYLSEIPVAVLKPASSAAGAAAIYYVYADQINTPRVIASATNGKNVWRWDDADPFGVTQPNEKPGAEERFTFNVRFPGQLIDPETNINYNYYRDYDPSSGRYIESDPIGLLGGINTYGYASGNPVMLFDATGENATAIIATAFTAYAIKKAYDDYEESKAMACRMQRRFNNLERYDNLLDKMTRPPGLTSFENEMLEYLQKQIVRDRQDAAIDGMKYSQNVISPMRGVSKAIPRGDLAKIRKGITAEASNAAGGMCGCEQ